MRYAPRTAWVIDSAYNPDAATTAPSSVRRECAQQRHHLGGDSLRIENSSPHAPPYNTPCPRACHVTPCANPHPTIGLEAEKTFTQY